MSTMAATTPAIVGLGISFDTESNASSASIASSPERSGVFSDIPLESSSSQTDPGSSVMGDSSDEDNFTVYSDEEPNITYLDANGSEIVQVSDYLPWPTSTSSPRTSRRNSWESYDSDELEAMDHGYESDAEELGHHNSWRHRRAKRTRRSRVHYVVQHIEPVFEVIYPFGSGDEIPPVPEAESLEPSSLHGADNTDEETDFPTIERLTGDMDIFTESEEDPSSPGPHQVEYTSERSTLKVAILLPITEEERRGLALGLPGYEISRFLRPAELTADGEIRELPVEESTPPPPPPPPVPAPIFGLGIAVRPQHNFRRSASFASVDLNDGETPPSPVDPDDFEVVVPETPNLRPWTAGENSPSPIFLTTPHRPGPFALADAPLMPIAAIPTAMTVAMCEPLGVNEPGAVIPDRV